MATVERLGLYPSNTIDPPPRAIGIQDFDAISGSLSLLGRIERHPSKAFNDPNLKIWQACASHDADKRIKVSRPHPDRELLRKYFPQSFIRDSQEF